MVYIDGNTDEIDLFCFGSNIVRLYIFVCDSVLYNMDVLHKKHKYKAKQDDPDAEYDSNGVAARDKKGYERLPPLDNVVSCKGERGVM